jgi:hypothetical protein
MIHPVTLDHGDISTNYVQGKRNLYTTGTFFEETEGLCKTKSNMF